MSAGDIGLRRAAQRAAGGSTGWGRVPALDGIRGLAVIAVLLFHGGVSWARGGFLGVDAFFVLSGLLITSLLLTEADDTGDIALGHFWSRRARRLLPALLAVIVAAGLYGAFIATPDALEGLRRDALATLAYVANWRYIAAGASYFESTAQPSILRHTWSLAIEEQFYVVWPLVMLAVARLASRNRAAVTAAIAGAGTLLSVAAMALLYEPGGSTTRAYYGTDTRAQAVLTGSLLAALIALVRQRAGRHSHREFSDRDVGGRTAGMLSVGSAVGLAIFVAMVATTRGTETWLFRGGFLVVAVAVALVLADVVLVPTGWTARGLSVAPLRLVGLISYGLYLWHWPIYLTLTSERTHLSGPALLGVRLAVTLGVSVASYVLLEDPIRRGALPHWRAGTLAPAAAIAAAVAVIAGTITPSATSAADATVVGAEAAADSTGGAAPIPRPLRPPIPKGNPAKLLVLGDSVAQTMAKQLRRVIEPQYDLRVTNKAQLGCGVVRGGPYRYFGDQRNIERGCARWPADWATYIEQVDPDVVLLIVGRWEVMDRIHDGGWTHLGEPAFDAYIEKELSLAVRTLTAGGALLGLATSPYFLRGERPDGGRWPEDDPRRVDRFNRIVRRVASQHRETVYVLELGARSSRGGKYTPVVDGVNMRFDGVHFSPEGSRYLAPWLFGTLRKMAPLSTAPKPLPTTTSTRVRPTTTSTTFYEDPDETTTTTEYDPFPSSTSTTRPGPFPTTTTSPTTSTTEPPTTSTTEPPPTSSTTLLPP